MQFAAGRPILAVRLLDQQVNPFAAPVGRLRHRRGDGLGKRFFSIGRPLPSRHGTRQRPSSRTSTNRPAIAAAAAMAGDTR